MRRQDTPLRNAIALVIAATIAACGGSSDTTAPPPTNDHTILATPSLTFGPASLTVNAGQTVTFDFGSVPHNVFFDAQAGAPADIAGNNANVSIDRVFTTAGTYHYTCHIHPGMQGTVLVH